MARNNLISFRQGTKVAVTAVNTAEQAVSGEPFYATDSKEVFIGIGSDNTTGYDTDLNGKKVIPAGVAVDLLGDAGTITGGLYVYLYNPSLGINSPGGKKATLTELASFIGAANGNDTKKVLLSGTDQTEGYITDKVMPGAGLVASSGGTATNQTLQFSVQLNTNGGLENNSGIGIKTNGITAGMLSTNIDASAKSFKAASSNSVKMGETSAESGYAFLNDGAGPLSTVLWSSAQIKKAIDAQATGMVWTSIQLCVKGLNNLPVAEQVSDMGGTLILNNPGIDGAGFPINGTVGTSVYVYNGTGTYNINNWVSVSSSANGTALVVPILGATTVGQLYNLIYQSGKQNFFVITRDYSTSDNGYTPNMYSCIRTSDLAAGITTLSEFANPQVMAGNGLGYRSNTNSMSVVLWNNTYGSGFSGLDGGEPAVNATENVKALKIKLADTSLVITTNGLAVNQIVGGTV